ncbi:hypothetical protein KY289_015449 [Solanum tuberosum]|nr:hypothetical protein KY289_015449 [Solanum tuberosum]
MLGPKLCGIMTHIFLSFGKHAMMRDQMLDRGNTRLHATLRHTNASLPENVMAYDNVVSALRKIYKFHHDNFDSAQLEVVVEKKILVEQW